MSLARAYEELADLYGAMDAYETVVELAPDYGAALLGLGRMLDMSGNSEGAIDLLTKALETGEFDDDPEALGMVQAIMGVAHRELGHLEQSLVHLGLSLEA